MGTDRRTQDAAYSLPYEAWRELRKAENRCSCVTCYAAYLRKRV